MDYAPSAEGDPVDPLRIKRAVAMIEDDELEKLVKMLEGSAEPDVILEKAMERLDAKDHFKPPLTFAPDAVKAWGLKAMAPIHFAHVNDVGAYKYARKEHFRAYGYVIAQLARGSPVSLQSIDLDEGRPHETVPLPEE
jgi:hypothetical protein